MSGSLVISWPFLRPRGESFYGHKTLLRSFVFLIKEMFLAAQSFVPKTKFTSEKIIYTPQQSVIEFAINIAKHFYDLVDEL